MSAWRMRAQRQSEMLMAEAGKGGIVVPSKAHD